MSVLGTSALVLGVPVAVGCALKALHSAPDHGFAIAAMAVAALEVIGLAGAVAFFVLGG